MPVSSKVAPVSFASSFVSDASLFSSAFFRRSMSLTVGPLLPSSAFTASSAAISASSSSWTCSA